MESISQEKIEELLENGYSLRVSDYISGGFKMVKQHLELFVGYTFLFFLIMSATSIIPFGSVLLSGPLLAGYFLAAHKIRQGASIKIGDFFKGFDYFGQLAVFTILYVLIFAALAIPVGSVIISMVIFDFGEEIIAVFGILFGFGFFATVSYLKLSFLWSPLFILFADKKAWESMELSHRIIKKDFWNFIGFGLIIGLINFVGFLCFGIGLLFTLPVSACALYLAFEDVTDLKTKDDDDFLESHFVD